LDDNELIHTTCNTIIKINPRGLIDLEMQYDDIISNENLMNGWEAI